METTAVESALPPANDAALLALLEHLDAGDPLAGPLYLVGILGPDAAPYRVGRVYGPDATACLVSALRAIGVEQLAPALQARFPQFDLVFFADERTR